MVISMIDKTEADLASNLPVHLNSKMFFQTLYTLNMYKYFTITTKKKDLAIYKF